ncbi:GNAT family N-acetyltransferase [Ekhidna sp.]|uniref:GNAT family N-acetyltransferase n=1 Tax=Ekhidna sp. TaxID=2608089 RepID=UPI003BAA5BAB
MNIRKAIETDIPAIVSLLASDALGSERENYTLPIPESYIKAFQNITSNSNQYLIVVEDADEIIGTAQLSLIPYMTYQGGIRAQIEAVRIKSDRRGSGIGEQLFKWMISKAKDKGAHLIQLTTDKKRPEALRFYEKIGFLASHEGLKMHF